MSKTVAIIDYDLGNLASVYNALEFIGADAFITKHPQDLLTADYAILPGVGAFGEGMESLHQNGWVDVIKKYATIYKKPFLGICLGMQLLASKSYEHGEHQGLNLIGGEIKKIDRRKGLRIPHVGWNEVSFAENTKTYAQLSTGDDFYFVHSYVFHPNDKNTISGMCNYGEDFVASLEFENIWGAQFHPEKSQKAGLQILKNFCGV